MANEMACGNGLLDIFISQLHSKRAEPKNLPSRGKEKHTHRERIWEE
jgi:hypothetical protein